MKKIFVWMLAACLSSLAVAQEKFELGKPNDDNYRYLDGYKALKEYIDYSKYPNFKLGAGTTVNDYLNNNLVKNLTNKNFTETVAGNAMKMASCVDYNTGNMNFTRVKNYVNAATNAGLSVYGHTLAWHSQQPKGWLLKLLADKPAPDAEGAYAMVASKDFRKDKSVGWKADEAQNGYSVSFDATNGLKVTTTVSKPWEVQFVALDNIPLEKGKSFKMTMTVKGSKNGRLDGHLGDWGTNNDGDSQTGFGLSVPFTSEWQDVEVSVTPTVDTNFLLLHVPNYIGDVYIKTIKFEGSVRPLIPQTAQEMHDTLVWAMDKWIKGMMEACGGKVKAWDLVNEPISGGGNDGQGNYLLQHSKEYNPNGNPDATWDVGGDAFFWQDYMGDLEYVRQACRLARKYGPEDIKLFINDYNLESDWDNNKKVKSLVGWIKKWEADGVTHIDGIGTQMHISCFENDNILNGIKSHITQMFEVMAASGKLCRVSEMDMGYVRGNDRWGASIKTEQLTEAEHKKMADFYEWIIQEYFRIIPPEQQWGICQWCTTDAPAYSGWRGGEPVGIWDLDYYRKHVYAGFVRGLNGGEPTEQVAPSLDKTELTIAKGQKEVLTATCPSSWTDQSVTWESSDPTIVIVKAGKIKGMKVGTATITCTSVATGLSATCEVTVGYVRLSKSEVTIQKGKTMTLKSKVYPTTLDQSVTWESSDPTIVKVASTGKIKGMKAGTATITCTSVATGLSATCEVTVGYVKLSKYEVSIQKGKSLMLKSAVYPTTVDQSVTWESSDPTIVKVTASGKIGGFKVGTATITCTSVATGLKATCEVTVVKASSAPSLDGTDDEVTGLDDMDVDPAAVEPFDVYDLNGRKTLHQVTSLDGLPDGIYIVNGKKILKNK